MNFKEEMERIFKIQEQNMKNERDFAAACKDKKDDEINDAAIELGLHADDDRDEIINKLNGGS